MRLKPEGRRGDRQASMDEGSEETIMRCKEAAEDGEMVDEDGHKRQPKSKMGGSPAETTEKGREWTGYIRWKDNTRIGEIIVFG